MKVYKLEAMIVVGGASGAEKSPVEVLDVVKEELDDVAHRIAGNVGHVKFEEIPEVTVDDVEEALRS